MRVLDCTHVMAGAWCSLILADLGADVIKIESPHGEVTRGGMGAFRPYDFMNRNKRAIAVDIMTDAGAQLLKRLAKDADVWVQNYRPGSLERVGLGYDDLKAVNPAIIYCSISGFGQTGPYRDRGGLDLVAQAMAGVMSFVGTPGRDRRHRPPSRTPTSTPARSALSASSPPTRVASRQAKASTSRLRYLKPASLTRHGRPACT